MTKRKPAVVGNYRFTGKVLGKGNFAKVEEATHELLSIKVAVKIMDLGNIKEEYVIKNLYREAKIMSKLRHPCIVSLFETIKKSDNTYYLVTEIVNGGDLCTYVKAQRNGKLEERSSKIFAQQFVSALMYMHQKGIVHRDLKMENVMLNSIQNQIKIVDFGLSNEWSADCPLKTHCGSPEYAAPELFVNSKVYGPEVDLWSLGIILYGMVVGHLPFVSVKSPSVSSQERRKILVAQINKGISTPQRKALSSFSFEFRNLLSKLLNANSKKRMTVKEMSLHPWITENGRRLVKENPYKKINLTTNNKIINDILEKTNLKPSEIGTQLKDEPFGEIAGMYNILVHKSTNKLFTPNLVTRSISDTETFQILRKKEKLDIPQRSVHTAREEETRKIRKILTPHAVSIEHHNESKSKAVLTKIVQLSSNSPKTPKESSTKIGIFSKSARPRSVQFKRIEIKEEKRPVTSALYKRREYSANLASRFNQSNVPSNSKCRKKDETYEITLRKRVENLHKGVPIHDLAAKQSIKNSDSDYNQIDPRIPLSSKFKTHKTPTNINKYYENKNSTELSQNPACMNFVENDRNSTEEENKLKASKKCSQKSGVSRYSDGPIEPRKTPGKTKLKTKRPSSCQSALDRTNSIFPRTSTVSEKKSAQPCFNITTRMEPGHPFYETYKQLRIMTKHERNKYNTNERSEFKELNVDSSLNRENKSQNGKLFLNRKTTPKNPSARFGTRDKSNDTKICKNIMNYMRKGHYSK